MSDKGDYPLEDDLRTARRLLQPLIVDSLKKAGGHLREAAQMLLPAHPDPEEAMRVVRTLFLRAVMPFVAVQELARLGETLPELLGAVSGPNKGCVVKSVLGWAWLTDIKIGDVVVPVAYSREQAEEIYRRLGEALR